MKKALLIVSTLAVIGVLIACKKSFNSPLENKTETLSNAASNPGAEEASGVPKYAPNQLLVKFKNGVPDQAFLRQQKSVVKEKVLTAAMKTSNYSGFHVLMVPDVEQAVESFKRNPNVEWANPNWTVKHEAYAPNDPYYTGGNLWGMGSIKASTAWNTNTGDQKIFVGVIDEGIMYWHEDLCGQIWQNPYETENGKDDDGNGYVDDMHGWDFMHNDNTIFDMADNHGTHVAGTIGGIGNNGKGVVGVSPNVTIISGKFLEGWGFTSDAVKAVDYMTDLKTRHGMNIATTSNSWGGGGYDQALYDAINRAKAKDILFTAAAGNDGMNTDATANYPSCYNLDNIISVAAYNSSETLPSWTNYGSSTVDIGAPGVNVLSTLPGVGGASAYDYYSGTSMATPHVAGAVALYKAGHPTATYSETKNAILNNARPISALTGKCVTGGVLNVSSFTQATTNQQDSRSCVVPPLDAEPPTAPTNFRVVSMDSVAGTAVLAWNASTDNVGVWRYAISVQYSWYKAWFSVDGNTLTYTASGLYKGVRYPVAVKAVDAWRNQSAEVPLSFDFFGYDVTPPTTPTNFKAVGVKPTSVTFSYDWSTDDMSGIGMYRIRYRVASCTSCGWTGWHTNGINPLEVPGLTTGTQYAFTIAAMDNNNNWSAESSPAILETPRDIYDVTPPTSPTLSIVSANETSCSLKWTSSTDNIGVMGYRVYSRGLGDVNWTFRGTTSNLNYTVTSLSLLSFYYDFYVEAYDNAGNVAASNIVRQPALFVPPTMNIALTGSVKNATFKLNWTTTVTPSTFTVKKSEVQYYQGGVWSTLYTQSTPSLTGTYSVTLAKKMTVPWRILVTLDYGTWAVSNVVTLKS